MSAQVTEAHFTLRRDVIYSAPEKGAQLIADSEAKACAELRAVFPQICEALGNGACCTPDVSVGFIQSIPNEVASVVAQLRAELGHLHGRIGLFAEAHFGINDNLPTDETFAQMSHALQMERSGLAIEEEKLKARAERAEAEVERLKGLRALEMHDAPDQWTPEIEAAHPCQTEEYGRYDTAMKMVGNRHGKYELVDLVNWLLRCADKAKEERSNNKKVLRAIARAERAEAEVVRLKADGAAGAFSNMACRASRAETDRNNLRADLDAIKAILNEEKDRAERAEAELKAEQDNSAIAEIELKVSRAIVSKIWVQLGSPTYEQLKGRSIYDLIDEMKAERARLDWLLNELTLRGTVGLIEVWQARDYPGFDRAAIDAAMKEDGK